METATTTAEMYLIPAQNYAELEQKLMKLNKKATKLGCQPIVLDVLSEEVQTDEHDMPGVYYRVRVSGERPILNGWVVIGWVEYLRGVEMAEKPGEYEDITLVFGVPGEVQPGELAAYDTAEAWCEHCRTRRQRNKTYILRGMDGKRVQVGKDCLKDFTGHQDPHLLASWAEVLVEMDQACKEATDDDLWELGNGKKSDVLPLEFYLSWVAMLTRTEGFVSVSKAERRTNAFVGVAPTYERALIAIDFARKYASSPSQEVARPTEEDKTLTRAALAWIRSEEAQEWIIGLIRKAWSNPYAEENHFGFTMDQVARLCTMRSIPERCCARVALVIDQYRKHLEKQEQAQRQSLISRYQGTVGQRGEWTLYVEAVITTEREKFHYRDRGVTFINKMRDTEGNVFTWCGKHPLLKKHTYRLRGTVKSHEMYKGVPTTYLTRCAVVEDLTPQEPAPEPEPLPDLGLCACGQPLAELYQYYCTEFDYRALHVSHCPSCGQCTRHNGPLFHLCVFCGFGDKEDEQGNLSVHHNGQWELDPDHTILKYRLERGY